MHKPNIVHICLSSGWGGLEMYPIRTAKEFLNRGYQVYGICLAGSQVHRQMVEIGVECFAVKSKAHLVMTGLLRLNRWLTQRQVETVHSHKSGDILVSALLHTLTARRSFFTEHMGVKRPKKDAFHRWVYRHLERVFSISQETYQRNINALPVDIEKITPLWLGTPVPSTKPAPSVQQVAELKQTLNIPAESPVVGTVGRVCYGKGQMQLLEAFEQLAPNYPHIHLLIVGGLDAGQGSDAEFIQQLKRRVQSSEFTDRIHLAGFRRDTEAMYGIMDVVCLPYHNEAFGLTTIEAMAQAKALVVSDKGALPEIVGETGLICDPFNAAAFADQIRCYLDNISLRNQYEAQAYRRAQACFSTATHIEKLSAYYMA